MKLFVFYLFILAVGILPAFTASAQNSSNPIPLKVMNRIYFEIQKQTTFSSINEKSSLIWTPKVIELQSLETENLLPSLYTPQETLFRLAFDVGMGHNMDDSILKWRRCDVALSLIAKSWGRPILHCEIFTP
jgi:hypothetical protein